MFGLILSLIAIVLVGLAATATLYYGGSALTDASSNAEAAQLLGESGQIVAAVEAYKVDNTAAVPSNVGDLVNSGYMNAAPASSWVFSTDAVMASVSDEASCIQANTLLGYNLTTVPLCSESDTTKSICCL